MSSRLGRLWCAMKGHRAATVTLNTRFDRRRGVVCPCGAEWTEEIPHV